jgi:hypothetical protein
MLAFEELLAVAQQQMRQIAGVTTVGLLLRALDGRNDDDFAATELLEQLRQSVVHAADLQDGEKAAVGARLFGKLRKEGMNLFLLSARLPLENLGTILTTQIHGQLSHMLVDTEVVHSGVSWKGER